MHVIPGPRSRELLESLRLHEARGVTFIGEDFPVVWESAQGSTVTDVDGNLYTDLTSAFGVANVGHANPRVVEAIETQARRMIHGMGDMHPAETKIRLLERLATVAPPGMQRAFFSSSGAEAIEFALKTAYLRTGRPNALAFTGAYHGLSLGALDVSGIERFRLPFAPLLAQRATYLPFPQGDDPLDLVIERVRATLVADPAIGAIVLEPIQGRGGVLIPPDGFLAGVRAICDEYETVLILDEIYTGFGRTGTFFACERERVVPDLLCIGKALAGGVPLSATLGKPATIDRWPESEGEALHTSTFLGNPLACAAALATIDEMLERDLAGRARNLEPLLRERLAPLHDVEIVTDIRGRGALFAVAFENAEQANIVVRRGLEAGLILLQSGSGGDAITIAPPLVITEEELSVALDRFVDLVTRTAVRA